VANYELVVRPSVYRDVKGIPPRELKRILERMEALRVDPHPANSVKLSGQESYRIRQGNYRIIYEIEDARRVVVVSKVGHRREIYR
jgi:mRNA interferase RelE/StbE